VKFVGIVLLISAAAAQAQPTHQVLSRVESGLQEAVNWKWKIEPGPSPGAPMPAADPIQGAQATPDSRIHVVKKGDALAKIARQYNVTVEQLKAVNDLKSDLIHIDDKIRIPSSGEMALMPATTPRTASPAAPPPAAVDADPDVLWMQVHLDRLGFSPGPIDGETGLRFQKLMLFYHNATGESPEVVLEKAKSTVDDPLTTYQLRPTDFQWIRQPPPVPKSTKTPQERETAAYRQLVGEPELLYRSAFEFVAERFHCTEAFLRKLNPMLKGTPSPGTVFRVPNVVPFEIETALEPPLRPRADPAIPVKAVVADLSWLEIFRGETLVAVFPLTVARPGLRGRGEWEIRDSISRPRLTTRRESLAGPETTIMDTGETSKPALLAKDEILGSGPRNPVGILWINLAKAGDADPLPYGLHGTSLPDRMAVTESLGGFRLTNWDIVRAARLLPEGTPLRWRQTTAQAAKAPAAATAPSPEVP